MGLTDRLQAAARALTNPARSWDGLDLMQFNGNAYPLFGLNQTLPGGKIEEIDTGYTSLVWRAYQQNAIVFACMRARLMLFTEARFGFQNMRGGRGADFFGDRDRATSQLALLDHPWPGATTGDLLKYMITDADLAGNAFVLRQGNTLKRLRPDWTRIIHGSPDPDGSMWDSNAELLGYGYQPGGPGGGKRWEFFDANEVAHFAPIPDPLTPVRGMSWLSPIVREIMGDHAMTEHKLRFHENGGTPNLVVSTGYTDIKELQEFMAVFRQDHAGSRNAYKAMGMTVGVDAKVVGADLRQLDFKVVQGAGETRIAAAAGVPPAVVGISEGLQGSALNEGNFGMAMRNFADLTMRPLWRNVAGSLEKIIPPPAGTRLWYDDRDVPALKDDIKALAEVRSLEAQMIATLLKEGFKADPVLDAILSGDWKNLKGEHTGMLSVQLQAPGDKQPVAPPPEPPKQLTSGLPGRDVGEVRCVSCNRLLAELATPPYRFTCTNPRCKAVNEADEVLRAYPVPQLDITPLVAAVDRLQAPVVNVTVEKGAIQVPITVEPAQTTIAEGAVQVTVEPSPVTIEEGAIHVENHPPTVTIEDGAIRVDVPAAQVTHTIEPGAVEVNVSNSPAETEAAEETAATLRSIDQQLRKPRVVDKTVIRDESGRIVGVRETET